MASSEIAIRMAHREDVALIHSFIRELAEYEKLLVEVVGDEAAIRASLFGPRPAAEVLIAELSGTPVGFALFFQSYSTFLARPGLYLEDLFVRPAARSRGVGAARGNGAGIALMAALARIAVDRHYGRFEWSVLDWNEPALGFYRELGALELSEWTMQRLTGPKLAALAARAPEIAR